MGAPPHSVWGATQPLRIQTVPHDRVALRWDLEPHVFFQTSSPGVPFQTRPRHAGVYEGEGRQYMVAYATGVPWLEAQEGTAEDLR